MVLYLQRKKKRSARRVSRIYIYIIILCVCVFSFHFFFFLASTKTSSVSARRRDFRFLQTNDIKAISAVEIAFENIRNKEPTVVPANAVRREKRRGEKMMVGEEVIHRVK